jgi:hypothetical protein
MTEAMFARAAYDGFLNLNAIKRLKRSIELIIAIAIEKEATNFKSNQKFKFKVNFITLTLPGPQGTRTDKQIKKEILDVWFKAAKRRFNLSSYVWRAERQKNGNLHFHIVSDCYIPFDQLRDSWNNRLERMGFISEFEKLHGHRHPNSTDVHSIKKVRDLAAYMVKYMCKLKKNEQRIDGKVWDCSTNLKRKDSVEFIIDGETEQLITNAIEVHNCKFKKTDNCTLVFYNEYQFAQAITGRHRTAYDEWLNSIRKPTN